MAYPEILEELVKETLSNLGSNARMVTLVTEQVEINPTKIAELIIKKLSPERINHEGFPRAFDKFQRAIDDEEVKQVISREEYEILDDQPLERKYNCGINCNYLDDPDISCSGCYRNQKSA